MAAKVNAEKSSEKSSARRDELLNVAARTFADRGYASTTTRDIAVEAKITSGSLYHHFDSKEAMVDTILRPYFVGLDALLDEIEADSGPPLEKLSRLMRETLQHSARYRNAARIYSHDGVGLRPIFPYIGESMDRLEGVWIGTLEAGFEDGSFTGLLNPGVVFRTMIGAMSYTTEWFHSDGDFTIEQIADFQIRLILDGLSGAHGRPTTVEPTPRTAAPVIRVDNPSGDLGTISVVIAASTTTSPNSAAVDAAVGALRAALAGSHVDPGHEPNGRYRAHAD